MKEKKLLDALNEIDDEFIEDANPQMKKADKKPYFKWITVAACLFLAIGVGFTVHHINNIRDGSVIYKETEKTTKETTTVNSATGEEFIEEFITEIALNTEIYMETTDTNGACETVAEDYWKKLDINQKYRYILFDNIKYQSTDNEIEPSLLGEKLTDALAKGTDYYNNKTYTKKAEIFSIKTFDKNCVVAVKFEKENRYFIYINCNCKFKTLDEIINKLNLEENIVISKSVYHLDDSDYSAIKYKPFEKTIIFKKLLGDKSLSVVKEKHTYSTENFVVYFSIEHIYPIYSISDCCFIIEPTGFLTVRVLNNDYHFFIGEEKAADFTDYIFQNYEGKKLVATTETPVVYNGAKEELVVTETFSNYAKP